MKKTMQLGQQELFSILSGRISTIINRYLLSKFKENNLGITVEQWTVLACLWQKDKVSQQALSDMTYRDKPSMTRLIDNLEKYGLVVRINDKVDRRNKLIHLTQKGIDLEKQATKVVNEAVERTLAKFSEREILTCKDVLYRVIANLAVS